MNIPIPHDILQAAERYAEKAATLAETNFVRAFTIFRTNYRNAHLDSYLTGAIEAVKMFTGDTAPEPWTDNDRPPGEAGVLRLAELLDKLRLPDTTPLDLDGPGCAGALECIIRLTPNQFSSSETSVLTRAITLLEKQAPKAAVAARDRARRARGRHRQTP